MSVVAAGSWTMRYYHCDLLRLMSVYPPVCMTDSNYSVNCSWFSMEQSGRRGDSMEMQVSSLGCLVNWLVVGKKMTMS